MSLYRSASSSPDLNKPPPSNLHNSSSQRPQDFTLEGCTTTLKLLIKLVQDHEASIREHDDNDDRSMSRVTGMINILDEVRGRLQKSQSSYGSRKTVQLRRCNTDLRPRRSPDGTGDDKSRAKAAKKSLEIMCSSLGKEKEIMAVELSKKVHELNEMEEHISDLKTQNTMLLEKLQTGGSEQQREKGGAEALLERNKQLSEQLLKVLEGYRSLKRKLKEAQDDKSAMQSRMEQMGKEVGAVVERVRGLKQRLHATTDQGQPVDIIYGDILGVQNMLESVESRILSNHDPRKRAPKPS